MRPGYRIVKEPVTAWIAYRCPEGHVHNDSISENFGGDFDPESVVLGVVPAWPNTFHVLLLNNDKDIAFLGVEFEHGTIKYPEWEYEDNPLPHGVIFRWEDVAEQRLRDEEDRRKPVDERVRRIIEGPH